MNPILSEALKKMNPTGIPWDEMTEDQKEAQRREWDKVAGERKNLYCSCPRTFCENNHNCRFCVATHRSYGSLPDCLRSVEDRMNEGVPPEKRHNIHKKMNPNQTTAPTSRDAYHNGIAAAVEANPEEAWEAHYKRAKGWHDLVRDPKVMKCPCEKTDCRFHDNCTKCIALHRYYNTFPKCCEQIHDNIAECILAYRAEQAGEKTEGAD